MTGILTRTDNTIVDLSRPAFVTMESFSHLRDAKLVSDDGRIFETNLIICDEVSRNRTMYGLKDIVTGLEDRRVDERMVNNTWFGEAEHPVSNEVDKDGNEKLVSLKRLMRVDPKNKVWRIDSWRVQGNVIRGVFQWAGDMGEEYRRDLLEHGSNYASSIRAFTPSYVEKSDSNGKYVLKTHPIYISTFDCVTLPGLEDTRIMSGSKYSTLSKNDKININTKIPRLNNHSYESVYREVRFDNVLGEIKDMMMSQESAHLVEDLFGIDLKSAQMFIRDTNTISVRTSESSTLELPLSRTILSRIL